MFLKFQILWKCLGASYSDFYCVGQKNKKKSRQQVFSEMLRKLLGFFILVVKSKLISPATEGLRLLTLQEVIFNKLFLHVGAIFLKKCLWLEKKRSLTKLI